MSDRLQELLRQKALLEEQMARLDQEISTAQARTATQAVTPPRAVQTPSGLNPPETDALLDQYRTNPQSIRQQVKWGCILYLLLALGLVAIGVAAIYLASHHN